MSRQKVTFAASPARSRSGCDTGSGMCPEGNGSRCTTRTRYTVYDGAVCITPPSADFPYSISPQLEYCRYPQGRRWKHLGESFPKTYRSVLALAPSWLTSNRALKSALRGCGIHTPSYAGTHVVLLYCHFFSRSYLKSGSSLVHTALHSQSQRSRRPSPTKAERENVSDGNAELV